MTRNRKIGSIKNELIHKSKESMLSAIQIFNNPNIQFKSESFIVLAIIAWTYLLHAYYRSNGIEYRYFEQSNKRKRFNFTKYGAYKYWELEKCLNSPESPIKDKAIISNLKFLIGLRHEIEHQMTTKIDNFLSARFQACCLNYNHYLKELFPKQERIERYVSISLQFSSLSEKQFDQLKDNEKLPQNISTYIQEFDQELPDSVFEDNKFSYRVFFVPKTVNRKGQADRVIEYIPANSEMAKGINKEYVIIKERERSKYSPSNVCKKMQDEGYKKFKIYQHTQLWKAENARDQSKGFGVLVVGTWYWYDSWIKFVRKHCEENKNNYI